MIRSNSLILKGMKSAERALGGSICWSTVKTEGLLMSVDCIST